MKNTNKIFIEIALGSLFIGISVFAFFYVFQSINTKNENTAILLEQIKTESDRRNKVTALNAEIKAIAPQRAVLETHFANSSDVVPFLDTLQELSRQALAPAEVSSVDLSKDGKTLEVSMNAQGDFAGISRLLALLQNSPYELDFSSVDIKRKILSDAEAKIASGMPAWNASFKLNLLSFSSN